MNLDDIRMAWPVPGPWTLRPTSAGTNNLSHFVDTPAGSYYLRVYQNTADPSRVRYEHALLLRLQRAGLSFAVPFPLTTVSGETYAVVPSVDGMLPAALFLVIPGEHPEHGNSAHAAICAGALGELDVALAAISLGEPPKGLRPYGALDQIHPLVPDPLAMVESLPARREQKARANRLYTELLALVLDLYGRLPQQIVHGDFGGSNVLVDGEHVTSILDFEFAGPDLRAIDLATGLWSFTNALWGTGVEWPLIEVFAGGYTERVALMDDEVEALPTLLRLREAVSLIHRVGRFRQGLVTEEVIARRVEALLRVDEWLGANGDELVRRVVMG